MRSRRIRRALTALLTAAFLVSAAMLLRQQAVYRRITSDAAEAAKLAALPGQGPAASGREVPAASRPAADISDPLPEEAAALAAIDLAALQAANEDVAGWIAIPGTELSYPLLQGEDNQFYLSHNWKGEASGGGSVYLESTCSRDLTDFHTIIYAHRMNNDSMFGTLKYYEDIDYWQKHPSVYIATGGGVYRYDIFAAHEAAVDGMVYRLDLEEKHLEYNFIRYCLDASEIDTGVIPKVDDRVLTLSTCTESGAARWVVHGVLVQVYETARETPGQ